jgi:sugar phosphate isomerase/epimerase
MHPLSIEFISVFGMPPAEFVQLAADLGCQSISTGLSPMLSNPPFNPHAYPLWSLRDNVALRRDTVAALKKGKVRISVGEGFLIRPGTDVNSFAADLAVMHELGAASINIVSIDSDLNRSFDQIAVLADLAHELGLQTLLEFGPLMGIPDLPTALAALRHVQQPHFRLLVDAMHLVRSGAGAADIAALDSSIIGYAQLCDAPLVSRFATYAEEAKFERMVPGTGELPLQAIVAALPKNIVIGIEVPQRSLAEAGVGPRERLGACVEATRALLRAR